MIKFFSYILESLKEEIHNFPLFIPVFIGIGIGYYFHLYNEPKTWVVYLLFILSFLILVFVNFGNSSDKLKHYKIVFIFSTFKYILKKILKFTLFALLLPIVGHITLFILIGSWVVSIFEYSYYLKYFALIYDNALMKSLLKGIAFVFSPLTKRIKTSKLFNYPRNLVKTSHSKKNVFSKLLKLFLTKTKNLSRSLYKGIVAFFNNAFFKFIIRVRKKIYKYFIKLFKTGYSYIAKYIPRRYIDGTIKFILSLNFILFFCVLGFFVIKLRTNSLDTKLLNKTLSDVQVVARVIASEDFPESYRFTFDNVKIKGSDLKLDKIRIKFSKKYGLPEIGSVLEFKASLFPPFEPSVVGGFNFARYSFFKQLSATGKSSGAWKISQESPKNSFVDQAFFDFLSFRNYINKRIEDNTDDETSGVIMSMMTGERYSIPESISEDYKHAGISHLLAISGFHMTLIVGFAFFLIRYLLAFYMPFANKYNTKKIAVFFALMVSIFYLFISGARLPTQRAFIMTTLALIAILIDRNPLSLRFVAVSAIIILLVSPEALINAGFQMSFVAVVSLIRLYEVREKWCLKSNSTNVYKKKFVDLFNMFWGNTLTSLLVGTAIIPFVIFNFNNLQIYSVLGNLFAIPLFSFVVMPSILFAFIFMPFGFDTFFFKITEVGILSINYLAKIVAGLPYASMNVKSMETGALLFIVFGMVWFFLWSQKWKKFGIFLMCTGLCLYVFSSGPDLLASKNGYAFAVNTDNNILDIVNYSKYKPSKLLLDNWELSLGKTGHKFIDENSFDFNGTKVGIVNKYKDYKNVCLSSDVVLTTFYKSKAYFKCDKPVFDRDFFKNSLGAEFYFGNHKVKYKTIKNYIGNRPWAYHNWNKNIDDGFAEITKEIEIFK